MKRDEDEGKREDDDQREDGAEREGDDDAGGVAPGEGAADDSARDASTQGIAAALGVDQEEGEAADEAAAPPEEEKAPPNRSARRREQALVRRKKRGAGATKPKREPEADAEEAEPAVPARDESLPKDKNARAKELLKRRQESAAAARRGGGPTGLDAGEMVQDALARGSSAAGRWFVDNARWVVGGVLVIALGFGGFLAFRGHEAEKAGASTGALAEALAADRGRVLKEDKRPDEEKELDPTRVFSTSEARADAAIAGYEKALSQAGEPGPTTLARLGLAGAKLEKGDTAGALEAYAAVLATPLAAADVDVRGRALEGTALAQEAKGDLDGALKSFEELAKVDAKGFEELGLYHQARVFVQKGDAEKAKELLKKAREKLSAPGEAGQAFPFLEAVVDGQLRSLDPSAVPARVQLGGAKGSSMTPEDLERIQEQLRKAMEEKGAEHEGEHEGEGAPAQEEPQ